MIRWYAANTHVNKEVLAAEQLKQQGFSVYLPKYMKFLSHARRNKLVTRPLFPRYLFVGAGPENLRWQAIQSTIGVSNLVCFGSSPAVVPPSIIEALKSKENEDGMITLKPKTAFKKGVPIKLISGPFYEQIGLFDHIDDKERVVILLNLMGRQVRVRSPIETVSACA